MLRTLAKNSQKNKKKSDPQNKKIKAVLFVPRTERGELLSRLKEEEAKLTDITGYRVKLVESSGTQLSRILCKRNPWAGQDCGRPDCLVCGEGEAGGGDCRRRNITYVKTCINCVKIRKEDNTAKEPARYIGNLLGVAMREAGNTLMTISIAGRTATWPSTVCWSTRGRRSPSR